MADSALATFHAMSMLAVIPFTILSARLGKWRQLTVMACLVMAVGATLLYFTTGPLVWCAVIMMGIVRDGYMAVLITMVTEVGGIAPELIGTAMGFILVFNKIGAMIGPPLGNHFAEVEPNRAFLIWALMAIISFITFHFVKENGTQQVPDA